MHSYGSHMANDYSDFTRLKYSSSASSKQLQELVQEQFSCMTVRRGCVKSLVMNLATMQELPRTNETRMAKEP